MTTTTLPPYKQLCQELLMCKFSEEEIEQVLRKYIPNLHLAPERTATALVWGTNEDIEFVLEEMELDDYTERDYDEIMGGWEESINEDSLSFLRDTVEHYERWFKRPKRVIA